MENDTLLNSDSTLEANLHGDITDLELHQRFRAFQRNYLAVYLIVMGSDWIQGPYLYKLYTTYGLTFQQIALLFLTGFLCGASIGTALGSVADSWGRRKICLLFCITMIASLCLRLMNTYWILLASHILSGTSGTLMYTVFESWYVSEHSSRGYPAEWRSQTFATGTFLNGLVAIIAGVVANPLVDHLGVWSPYVLAMLLLFSAATLMGATWNENYGDRQGNFIDSLKQGYRTLFSSSTILVLCAAQTFFEVSMYTFVLLYTPAIQNAAKVYYDHAAKKELPLGYLFSTMMLAVMCGSLTFRVLGSLSSKSSTQTYAKIVSKDRLLVMAFVIAATSFCTMAIRISSMITLGLAYHAFEFTTGIYYPSISSLKAEVIPEESRASVMNLVRVPMNISIAAVFWNVDTIGPIGLFALCSIMTLAGALLTVSLYRK